MVQESKQPFFSEVTKIPEIFKSNYIPSLNGFRAFSIIGVVICHIFSDNHSNNLLNKSLIGLGSLGVYVFFVISGFLITTLLLKEKCIKGSVSLRRFYKRRFIRILPLAYLYIAVVAILKFAFHFEVPLLAFFGAGLFLINQPTFNTSHYFGHYWSLSYEEQFYLIFPFIFKVDFKVYLRFLIALLFLIILFRHLDLDAWQRSHNYLKIFKYFREFIKKLDGIVIGSLLSIMVFKNRIPLRFIKDKKLLINVLFVSALLVLNVLGVGIFNNEKSTILSLIIALLIITNIQQTNSFAFNLLNNKAISYIGVMSYSIYIWQQLFAFRENHFFKTALKIEAFWPNIVVLGFISYISYNYYEKPFFRLKGKS
jgi:peptidoglycan/LPS O-acetylase OafA/YrhL